MYKDWTLDEIIYNMRLLGEMIIPYNFPKVAPIHLFLGDALIFFKERDATIDGYSVFLHYQKSDYDSHYLETLQIYNKSGPFLPFNLVCKLGKRFLGPNHLSLVEIFRENRKIYCWSVAVDDNGSAMVPPYDIEIEDCQFEGLNYIYLQPNQVSFF